MVFLFSICKLFRFFTYFIKNRLETRSQISYNPMVYLHLDKMLFDNRTMRGNDLDERIQQEKTP